MNTCVFSTHTTLTKEHAQLSIWSLFNQSVSVYWDNIVLYNTHPDVVPNGWLVREFAPYNDHFDKIFVHSVESTTLTRDVLNQLEFLADNGLTNEPGRFLILKSDYSVSKNFNKAVLRHPTSGNWMWSPPGYGCKEWVTDDMILDRLELDTFVPYDEYTYYMGGQNTPHTPGGPMSLLPEDDELQELHPSIRFVSHNIHWDYTVHVFSNDLLPHTLDVGRVWLNKYINNSWGGVHNLFNNMTYQRNTDIEGFTVHKYHGIKSENCPHDRLGGRKDTPGQRY